MASRNDMQPQSPASPRPAAVAFVLVSVVLDVMALGLVIPVLPKLIEEMSGSTAEAAVVYGVFATAWALMQFVFSPVLGALSDAFGRRPVLLVSSLGLGCDYVMMAIAPSLGWLFLGRVLSGICAATFSTASAYIADVTPETERAGKFGLIGAAFGVGFVLGPAIGGLLGAQDPRLPFWVAAALSLACAAYGYFVLPESLREERRSPFRWRTANPLGALELIRSDLQLSRLSLAMFLFHLAHAVLPAVFVLHAGYRFDWGPGQVGLALAAFGIVSGFVQGVLVKRTVARFGEQRVLVFGMCSGIVGLGLMSLAASEGVFWFGMAVICLWGCIGPAAQGLMSRRVGHDQQGRLQGANASLMGVANLIGPSLFTGTFAVSIAAGPETAWPGAPYGVAATCL
ncbi:MAG: TCR/Tet family MFS transporter, partial [Hyphomicrobiaceae bacterium]